MRIGTLKEREDFDAVLTETLAAGWSTQFGRRQAVSRRPEIGQTWLVQPLLSAYFVSNLTEAPRRFLRDSFRYTPRRVAAVPQWILGTALASSSGLRLTGRFGFAASPPLPCARHLLVVPGNQRIHVFDFARQVVRVFLKNGFDPATMLREIAIRGSGRKGPFPALLEHAEDGSWFEDPIIDGYSLPRAPPWVSKESLSKRAVELLEAWLAPSVHVVCAQEAALSVANRVRLNIEALAVRFATPIARQVAKWLEPLASAASELGDVELAQSHGDFQPGNVMVTRAGDQVLLIDWEHSGIRFRHYDRLVFCLRSRRNRGIASRLLRFATGQTDSPALRVLPTARTWRRSAVAFFLLEDLEWYTHENLTGPFHAPGGGLLNYEAELTSFGPGLAALLRGP